MAVSNEDIARLRRQQNSLQEELKMKSAEIEAERNRIIEENRREIRKLRSDTAFRIREHDEKMLKKYNSILENTSSAAVEKLQEEFNEYRKKYNEVCTEIQSAYAEEQRKTEDILRKQNDFEKAYYAHVEYAKKSAMQTINDTVKSINNSAQNQPLEWFFPGHLELYRSHLRDMEHWFEMGFYESAIGIGNNMMLSLELDVLQTEERFGKWFHYYTILSSILEAEKTLIFEQAKILPEKLSMFIKRTGIKDNCMTEELMNYWSDGKFSALKEEFKKYSSEIDNFFINGIALSDEKEIRRYMIENPEKSLKFGEIWLYNKGNSAISHYDNVKKIIKNMYDKIFCFEERLKLAKYIGKLLKANEYKHKGDSMFDKPENPLYLGFTDFMEIYNFEVIITPVFRLSDNKWVNIVKCCFQQDMSEERIEDILSCVSEVVSKVGISISRIEKIKEGQSKGERIKLSNADAKLLVNGRLN